MNQDSRPPWLRDMRRAERALDDHRVHRILAGGHVCRVGLCHESWPYVIPMNYAWADGRIYLHSACQGTKLHLLQANPQVCFEVTGEAEVESGPSACDVTMRYESVIGWGTIRIVRGDAERRAGLQALLAQLALQGLELPSILSSDVVVLRIDPSALRGKSSRDEAASMPQDAESGSASQKE